LVRSSAPATCRRPAGQLVLVCDVTQANSHNISVSHRRSVALPDEYVGLKT
jgi:hypothetical protein